ncbi:hypothetical protein [Yoonia sp.]|uniref:hypothetical protein n=1 Tax=Yoonia sp. TaxID=2212373 RepID=UPI0025DF6B22|nr:hypothetical protein [Yoonia sp.]
MLGSIFLLSVFVNVLQAQEIVDPIAIVQASGVCAPFGVASATAAPDGTIRAVCNDDATAFVPLLGGLGPVLGAGAAVAVASAVSGGNATPDTQ